MSSLAAAPSAPATERELELRRAEQEIAALEAQLAAELARVEQSAKEISQRLQQAKAAASQLQLSGLRDQQFQGLNQRLHGTALPQSAASEPRDQALVARAQAVQARKRASDQLRQAIQLYAADLTRLHEQIASDETALKAFEQKLADAARHEREETARKEREETARREETTRREATRKSGEKTQPPERTQPSTRSQEADTQPPDSRASRPPGGRSDTLSTQKATPIGKLEPRDRRVRMQASIDLKSESNFYQGFSTNLSEGGIFVATVQLTARGTPVDLQFTLPGGKKLEVKGEVRWVREPNDLTPEICPGVGIQFTELSADAAAAIKAFIASREPMFFPD